MPNTDTQRSPSHVTGIHALASLLLLASCTVPPPPTIQLALAPLPIASHPAPAPTQPAVYPTLAPEHAPARPGAAQLGVYLGAGCTGRDRLAGFENWLGRRVDRINDALSTDSWRGMEATALWAGRCWGEFGDRMTLGIPMIPLGGVATLASGAKGEYDENFRKVAKILVAGGHGGAVLRIGWEFNANWFPWGASKQPAIWAANWRRIVEAMRSVPGANFKFDWCPIIGVGAASPEAAYPGDDVVDFIGADAYNTNWNPLVVTGDQRFEALRDAAVGLKWQARFADAHGKPMSYPEWGTGTRPDGHGGGDDSVFIARMAEWIRSNNVAYHNYWDYPAKDYNAKLSDGSKPAAAAEFLRRFGGAN